MLVASPSDDRCAPGCSLYSRERVLLCFIQLTPGKLHRQLLTWRPSPDTRLEESTRALSRACLMLPCTYSHLWLSYVDSYSCLPCTNLHASTLQCTDLNAWHLQGTNLDAWPLQCTNFMLGILVNSQAWTFFLHAHQDDSCMNIWKHDISIILIIWTIFFKN